MTLSELVQKFSTEIQATEFLEKTLWPDGPVCPHCGALQDKGARAESAGTQRDILLAVVPAIIGTVGGWLSGVGAGPTEHADVLAISVA